MTTLRRKTMQAGVALTLIAGLTFTAVPAQASWVWWSHGSSYTNCMKQLGADQMMMIKAGYTVGKAAACKPNPYRAGWWRTSFSYWR
jgi:hypothetical protein